MKVASRLRATSASKDPTTFTVLLEDSAAVAGLLFAFLGAFLGERLGMSQLDGAASLAIGLLLASVALLLAHESKGLLIGEGINPAALAGIRRLVQADPAGLRSAASEPPHRAWSNAHESRHSASGLPSVE